MDGCNPRPFCVRHNTGASVAIQSEVSSSETYPQVLGRIPKTHGSMMASEVTLMLSKGTIEDGPGISILIPLKNGESHFIITLKLLN